MNIRIKQCDEYKPQVRHYLISALILDRCIRKDQLISYSRKLMECSSVPDKFHDIYFIISFLTYIHKQKNYVEHRYDDLSDFVEYFNELSDERKEWIKEFAFDYLTTEYRYFLFTELKLGSTKKS